MHFMEAHIGGKHFLKSAPRFRLTHLGLYPKKKKETLIYRIQSSGVEAVGAHLGQ